MAKIPQPLKNIRIHKEQLFDLFYLDTIDFKTLVTQITAVYSRLSIKYPNDRLRLETDYDYGSSSGCSEVYVLVLHDETQEEFEARLTQEQKDERERKLTQAKKVELEERKLLQKLKNKYEK